MRPYRKYKNRFSFCNQSHKHPSMKEAGACNQLNLMQLAKEIKNLKQQPKFILQPGFIRADGKKVRPITYTADFSFYDNKYKRQRIIDIKSVATIRNRAYVIKKKMLDYQLKIKGLVLEEEI